MDPLPDSIHDHLHPGCLRYRPYDTSDDFIADFIYIYIYILIVDHVAVALVASGKGWTFHSRAAWVGDMDGAGNVLGVGGLQVREWLAA